MNWVKNMKKRPRKIFINHGELEASTALKERLEKECQIEALVPRENDRYLLS
jgi:metallo-beta-lactamase family protein